MKRNKKKRRLQVQSEKVRMLGRGESQAAVGGAYALASDCGDTMERGPSQLCPTVG
jgi:hypothetical protein